MVDFEKLNSELAEKEKPTNEQVAEYVSDYYVNRGVLTDPTPKRAPEKTVKLYPVKVCPFCKTQHLRITPAETNYSYYPTSCTKCGKNLRDTPITLEAKT